MTAGETQTASETHRAIEATFRIERARLIAGLARMVKQKPQRLLQVEWAGGDAGRSAARLLIEAFDRRALLRDISDVIAAEHISIDGVSSHTDPDDRIARFEVRLTVRDAGELARLQRRLARVANVFKVSRAR